MADLDVERKPRPMWPWIVVLLLLLLLAWLAWNALARGPAEPDVVMTPVDVEDGTMVMQRTPAEPADEIAGVTRGSVARFVATCGDEQNIQARADGAAFELACLREMTNALAGIILSDTLGSRQLDEDLQTFRREVQSAERDRLTLESDPARFGAIASRAVDLMAALQSTRAPTAQTVVASIGRAREAAGEMRAGVQARNLEATARSYFSASAEALQLLERPRQ